VFSYRFIYGMRAVIPFLLGAGRCRGLTFALLSAASAIAWALVFATGGYYCGSIFQSLILKSQYLQKGGLAGGACLVAIVCAWRWWKYRRARSSKKQPPPRDRTV
jgi:membrane protein DedA with SNARE-associated domain